MRRNCRVRATFLVIGSLAVLLILAKVTITQLDYDYIDPNVEKVLELQQGILTEQHLLELEEKLISDKNYIADRDKAAQMGRDLIVLLMKDVGSTQDNNRLVTYVRGYMLNPPSHLPYNLKDNTNSNPSEHNENIFALDQLTNKKHGFYIECGANDGESHSNTLLLERDYEWSGLLIEADPRIAGQLMSKNRKAWTSSACLSPVPTPKMVDFHIGPPSSGRIFDEPYRSNVLSDHFGREPMKKNTVPVLCIPLYTYLLALGVSTVDYFILDVEGAELHVLKTIPFSKVTFLVLQVEVQWVPEGKEAVRKFLEDRQYVFVKEINHDYIFVHSSLAGQ